MISLFINWNPSPDIFTIPGIDWPVRWYGLSWAMAFIGCHFFMNRIYKAEGRTESQLDVLTLYIVIATVLGARLGHCLFYGWVGVAFGEGNSFFNNCEITYSFFLTMD